MWYNSSNSYLLTLPHTHQMFLSYFTYKKHNLYLIYKFIIPNVIDKIFGFRYFIHRISHSDRDL